jgi:hypothetical protein
MGRIFVKYLADIKVMIIFRKRDLIVKAHYFIDIIIIILKKRTLILCMVKHVGKIVGLSMIIVFCGSLETSIIDSSMRTRGGL